MSGSRSHRSRGALVALVAAFVLGSCGTDDEPREPGASTTATTSPPVAEVAGEPLLVRTRVVGFDGTVLAGSVLGQSPFCPGGVVHHATGSLDIGFPAINELRCDDGGLRIGFGPDVTQMENLVQTSTWRVLDGTGRYAGATGEGRMIVQFEESEPPRGVETFVGIVDVP